MTLGFPTILIPNLSGNNANETFSLGQEAISWIGSVNLICVPVGCLLSGAITQPIGRKRAMQLVNLPFVIAWLLFYFATDVWQIFLALCITGVTGGLLEAPCLTYIAEITEPHLRGILSATAGVAVLAGVLIEFFLGTFLPWRTVAIAGCVPPLTAFILLFFLPESPHWLVQKKRYEEAQRSLAWFRGWASMTDVQPEFEELRAQMEKTEGESARHTFVDDLRLFTKKNFLWPYMLVVFTFFLSNFCGVTPVQVYAVKIFSSLHTPINEYYATIGMGAAQMIGCLICSCVINLLGKRVISFVSLVGCGACFFTAAIYGHLNNLNYLTLQGAENEPHDTTWVPMVLLIGAAFFATGGIKMLPWLLIGEVYSNETRAMASGFSGGTSYIFGFLVNKTFPLMVAHMTLPGTFWFYSSICFLGTILLYFVLPETEGKTLHDISEHFSNNLKLGNQVTRRKAVSGHVNQGYAEENVESRL